LLNRSENKQKHLFCQLFFKVPPWQRLNAIRARRNLLQLINDAPVKVKTPQLSEKVEHK